MTGYGRTQYLPIVCAVHRMSTYQTIMKNMTGMTEALIEKFIIEVSNKFEVDKDELTEMWKNLPAPDEMAPIMKKTTRKKKNKRAPTAYQNFSNLMRSRLREENPDATFGEISTLLSKIWAGMSADEKAAHKMIQQPPPPPAAEETDNEEEEEAAPIVEEEVPEPTKKTKKTRKEVIPPPDNIPADAHGRWNELNEMSATDLRAICKERRLHPSIRRVDMIKSIITAEYDDDDTQED